MQVFLQKSNLLLYLRSHWVNIIHRQVLILPSCYFQAFYDRVLFNEHEPEMRRAPLDKIILDTKCLDMGPPKEILALALDPPDLGSIKM